MKKTMVIFILIEVGQYELCRINYLFIDMNKLLAWIYTTKKIRQK